MNFLFYFNIKTWQIQVNNKKKEAFQVISSLRLSLKLHHF